MTFRGRSFFIPSEALSPRTYENYCKARLNTSVTLKTLLIPWLDVNQKIQYTSPKTGEVHQYLIKEISMNPTDFTMEMKLTRFYNAYPWL